MNPHLALSLGSDLSRGQGPCKLLSHGPQGDRVSRVARASRSTSLCLSFPRPTHPEHKKVLKRGSQRLVVWRDSSVGQASRMPQAGVRGEDTTGAARGCRCHGDGASLLHHPALRPRQWPPGTALVGEAGQQKGQDSSPLLHLMVITISTPKKLKAFPPLAQVQPVVWKQELGEEPLGPPAGGQGAGEPEILPGFSEKGLCFEL